MGTVDNGSEASDRTHTTELKQLWVSQNDLREPEMKLEANSSSLQNWLQLTYELELRNYNAKKAIAEQQLLAAKEKCEKLSNRGGNFMGAFRITGGGSVDDVNSQIIKAKAALFDLTTDLQEIMHRWKQIEMLCGFPISLNPGIASLESILHPNLINGAMRSTHSDVVKTDNNDNEKKSKSSSLKDDRLGDLSTSKIKLEIESSARVVDASKTSHMGSSSLTEKQQKQMKTGSSESDEIIIILPPQKPQPPEIIIYDDEETIPVGNEAKVSRHELNHSVSSDKSTIIPSPLPSFSKSSPSFILKASDVPNYSTVPPVSTVVYPRELPPNLSSFKIDNEDLQIVKVEDDSTERNLTPPSLSPCPQTSHANFTIPNRYTAADIKHTILRQNKLINYEENLDTSEYISEYEEHINEKNSKRSLDEPINEYEKHIKEKKAKQSLDEPRSEYEKEIEERRAKNLEFLKSIGLDEAKNDFIDAVNSTRKKRERKSIEKSEPTIKRTSKRRKELIYYKEDRWMHEQRLQSDELTFKKALKSDKFYEDFVKDFNGIAADDCIVQTPVLYNKDVLKQLSEKTCLWSNKIYNPSALSWYPSTENFVLAVGGSSGNLGLWNIKESNYEPHVFSIHSKKVSNLQFNPCNPFHIISSSLDGTLVCCDMQKQISSKVLKISDVGCSYFDTYSPSSYLLSLTNGQVVIADKRLPIHCEHESFLQRRYFCHNFSINTINVHPVAKNYFVTAGSDRNVCVWDLRKLTGSIYVETSHRESVHSAFFSPVSGKFLLTTSRDKTIRIFDCENMTTGNMKLHKAMKYVSFLSNACTNDPCKSRLLWLPNSDDAFACSKRDPLTMVQIYDKDLNVYETIPDGTPGCKYLNMFHPFKAAFTSVTPSGYIKVFA